MQSFLRLLLDINDSSMSPICIVTSLLRLLEMDEWGALKDNLTRSPVLVACLEEKEVHVKAEGVT